MKTKRFFSLLGLFLFLYGALSSSEAVVDRVVAVVNQEMITLSEVEKWAKPLQEQSRHRGSLGKAGESEDDWATGVGEIDRREID